MINDEYIFTRTTYKPEETKQIVSSEIYYYDKDGEETSKENATSCRIVEFDSNNERVREIYGNIEKKYEERHDEIHLMRR